MSMGNTTDSAPSYEELYHNHPANGYTPSGSSTTYTPVPQDDSIPDTELGAQNPLQDLSALKHVHCEACDNQRERVEQRRAATKSCYAVAATFMVIALCLMVLGIVLSGR